MTAIQLNSALHRELSHIVTDTKMMERALKSLRQIRREHRQEQTIQGDSKEQVIKSLQDAFQDLKLLKEGKCKARPVEDLMTDL